MDVFVAVDEPLDESDTETDAGGILGCDVMCCDTDLRGGCFSRQPFPVLQLRC